MGFWKKKKAEETEKVEFKTPCELGKHKYRDFDWYIQVEDRNKAFEYEKEYILRVIEPYVCVHCGFVNNVTLDEWKFASKSSRDAMIDKLQRRYKKIGNFLEIQDEIKDMQLVDREYLNIMQQLHPEMNITGDKKDE